MYMDKQFISPQNFLNSLGILGGSSLSMASPLELRAVMHGVLSLISNVQSVYVNFCLNN